VVYYELHAVGVDFAVDHGGHLVCEADKGGRMAVLAGGR